MRLAAELPSRQTSSATEGGKHGTAGWIVGRHRRSGDGHGGKWLYSAAWRRVRAARGQGGLESPGSEPETLAGTAGGDRQADARRDDTAQGRMTGRRAQLPRRGKSSQNRRSRVHAASSVVSSAAKHTRTQPALERPNAAPSITETRCEAYRPRMNSSPESPVPLTSTSMNMPAS